MTTALVEELERTHVIRFVPMHSRAFPDDGTTWEGEVIVYQGEVLCPGCHHPVPVRAEDDRSDTGICCRRLGPNKYCGTRITVMVDPDHLRMDDSRPRESGYGCVCEDPGCRWWQVSA